MTMDYGVMHEVSSFERLMCCEVEFFGRCVFEEGATNLFSLIVVFASFHAPLPDS